MIGRSIHDNVIYGYTVDCERQRIILHTEFHETGRAEYTDVIFLGVLVHHFERVLMGNILFSIDEVEPDQIIEGWQQVFMRQKQYCWPAIEYQALDELAATLRQRGLSGYEISSSYGMSGWVLAEEMEICARESKMMFT